MLSRIFRPIVQLSKLSRPQQYKQLIQNKQFFKFSTSIEKLEKAQQKLAKALDREIKFEKENYQQDETVQEFLNDKGYTLIEKDDDINMELTKQVGQNKLSILFQSRSPQSNEDDQPQDQESEQAQGQYQQQEDPQDMQDYCEFTVYIESPNGALVYECSSFDSEVTVHAIQVTHDVKEHKSQTKLQRMSHEYTGPVFNTLDERLQTSLIEYMKSMGVDEELAAFVEHVSLDKEQKLYVKWLEGVKNFVK